MPPRKHLSRSSSTSSVNSTTSTESKKRTFTEMDEKNENAKEAKRPKVTTVQLYEMLENIKLDTTQIPEISKRVDIVENNIVELQKADSDIVSKIDKVNERIDNIGNVALNEELMRDVRLCKSVLQVAVPEINKNLLRSNNNSSVIKDVAVSGVPFMNLNNEQLIQLTLVIFSEIKVKIDESEIIDAFYLMKKSGNMETGMSDSDDIADKVSRIPFVVKLNNTSLVKKIIAAKRRYKKLEFSKLKTDNAVISLFKNSNNFTIFINESLSKYHYNLLKSASKKLKEQNNFKKVWQSNGFVYAQFSENLPLHQISSEFDIDKLLSMYVTEK